MQELTGKRNNEGREEEGCVISSLDASYVLFKRGVTTIYDRGCSLIHFSGDEKNLFNYLTQGDHAFLVGTFLFYTIGHFRVHVCLLFKASLSAKFLL